MSNACKGCTYYSCGTQMLKLVIKMQFDKIAVEIRMINCQTQILGVILVCIAIIILMIHQRRKNRYFYDIGITCAPTWPVLGAFPSIMWKGILQHDIDSIQQHGKLFGYFLGNMPTLVVSDPDIIKEIFIKQFNKFPYRMQALYISKWWDNGVVMAVGDHWKYLRSILSRTFSTSKLKQIQPVVERHLGILVSSLSQYTTSFTNPVIDMRKLFADLTLDIICETSFGVQLNTLEDPNNEFAKYAKIVSTLNIESNPVNALPLIIRQTRSIFEYFDIDYVDKKSLNYIKSSVAHIIEQRKSKQDLGRYGDTLDAMMNIHKEGTTPGMRNKSTGPDSNMNYRYFKERGLTDDELIANCIIMLMAGYDTTSTTLCWMAFLLATNQRVQEKLLQELDKKIGDRAPTYELVNKLDYMDMFLSETLRLYPAANRTGRDAIVDTEVCGYKIPKDLSVLVPIYAMHRLPDYWIRPNECIPERFDKQNGQSINPYIYMPFGVGPRACLGINMAKMLCKQIMAKFLQHFRLDITDNQELPPILEKSLLTKPVNGMKLRVLKR